MENVSPRTDPWIARELAEQELKKLAMNNYLESIHNPSGEGPPPEFPIIGYLTWENAGALVKALKCNVHDPRKAKGVRHNFIALMLVILVAACCAQTGPTAIAHFCMLNYTTFGGFFKTVPSHDTFRRILALTNPKELSSCLQLWLINRFPPSVERDRFGKYMVHIDGKAILACARKSMGDPTVYYLDATIDGIGMLMMVKRVDSKHNEQYEIPGYIEDLHISGAVITTDAAGAYNPVAQAILGSGCEYFLSLKKGLKNLFGAVEYMLLFYDGQVHESIADREPPVQLKLSEPLVVKEKEHGGWNTFSVQVIQNAQEMLYAFGLVDPKNAIYTNTKSIAIIHSERERFKKGKLGTERSVRYYISSVPNLDPQTALLYRRNHWKLEAKHHTLDVDFEEDRHTARVGFGSENGNILRRFALGLRDNHPLFSELSCRTFVEACKYNVPMILRDFLTCPKG